MFEKRQEEAIVCWLTNMASVEDLKRFLKEVHPTYRGYSHDTKSELLSRLVVDSGITVSLKNINSYSRKRLMLFCREESIALLTASDSVLTGHSWEKLSPSYLHRGFQELVRQTQENKYTVSALEEYYQKARNVASQELLITLVHDLVLQDLLNKLPDMTVPALKPKSIFDLLLNGVPYDLKVTSKKEWTSSEVKANPKKCILDLTGNADKNRKRKQAVDVEHGCNRLFVVQLGEKDSWLISPEKLLSSIVKQCKGLGKPYTLEQEDGKHLYQLITI